MAIAAIIFISSDFLIPAATQAFVPPAAPVLLPIVSNVIVSGGTAVGLATIAAPIIIGGFVIGAAYYYWSQEQTEQAEIKAEEKYCSANLSDLLCDIPPPFTGGQNDGVLYRFTLYYKYSPNEPAVNYLIEGVVGPIEGVRTIKAPMPPGSGLGYVDVKAKLIETRLDRGGGWWNMVRNSITNEFFAEIRDVQRMDGQPDTGGNLPSSSSFNWKDWPQDKRQAATSLLTDDDLIPILKLGNTGVLATGQSFPNGIHFFPGDGQPATFLPGPLTVSDHLSQPTPSPSPEPSPEPSPIPSPIPLPSPNPEPTPPPPPPSPEPEPQPDAGGAMDGAGGSGGGRPKLVFEPSPKHGIRDRGNISRGPTNGQATLNNSVQVRATSTRRVGVDKKNNEIVVFDETTTGVFHGHVRNWDQLTSNMKNALTKAGLVNRRGQILK